MLDSIFSGTMDMGIISANVAATTIPEFNCIVLPFYFDSFEQVGSVIANEEVLSKDCGNCGKKGVHFRDAADGGARNPEYKTQRQDTGGSQRSENTCQHRFYFG